MAKYSIVDGSVDFDDQSVAMCDANQKNIKYMRGDLLAAFKQAKSAGVKDTLEEVMSWQREQLEAGKPAAMSFVKGLS